MDKKFGAQLYTLREELKRDYPAVFRELKKMGWAGVQLSALPEGYDPHEISALLRETGLRTAGIHVSLDRLTRELDSVLEEVHLYNTRDIICPNLPNEYRSIEGYRYIRQELNDIADRAKGIRISYHNHAFEFETTVNGQSALEYLLEPTYENMILAEIDVFWVKKGGYDPLQFIQRYAHRMPIIHLKDMTADEHQTFAEVGTGLIDFEPILKWGERSGVEWYVVEQDQCQGNPMESLEISLNNLNRLSKQLA
ncbi:sugar phosphate isomerase/epimerase family protein [Halalkalibacter akibai]|uniref:Sugar phosphate isomerase/epimerase n=1 Tax=Halalkalibacter akibai (strain ATCC 43226 / DSM 21942 / CIP 109018 / JCM 9157 / 1139) TaxID=1236973 RepID=W4QUC7_HALA3|nr:sugar phosphate isomerase/epimerase [Halalkalibacter akibai]GAE35223.1 sugar phosphate isomerase/epimerase [Halalkalibacter akibai JCM 9157]